MSDGLWLRYWPYQTLLPQHPEPAEEPIALVERVPGLIDEAN